MAETLKQRGQITSDLLQRKGMAIAKNIYNLSPEERKKRAKMAIIYFTYEKILIGIAVVIIIIYTIWVLLSHKNAETEVERQRVEFNHHVLWGKAGTDGTLHLVARLMFGFVVLLFTGKYIYYVYKNNIDLFQEEELE